MLSFGNFLQNILVETLHPELRSIVTSGDTFHSKQSQLAKKIKNLSTRGEHTGIEGNMPKGSSRAYLRHQEPHKITLDGKETQIPVGTKVAIRAALDKSHDKLEHNGLSLGAMQNRAEGSHDNDHYRILTHDEHDAPGHFQSNHRSGIFPPLLDHDHKQHQWTEVGHTRDIKPSEFQSLTKTPDHPKGISHRDFVDSLVRHHDQNYGRHWDRDQKHENKMDHVETHPLVDKFMSYHDETGHSPSDYRQKKNLGVFEHPDGSKHIVARDHGFDTDVDMAYRAARRKQYA
jgi:hypothetical protein